MVQAYRHCRGRKEWEQAFFAYDGTPSVLKIPPAKAITPAYLKLSGSTLAEGWLSRSR